MVVMVLVAVVPTAVPADVKLLVQTLVLATSVGVLVAVVSMQRLSVKFGESRDSKDGGNGVQTRGGR